MSSTELEVKLEIGSESVRRLPGKSALRQMALGKPSRKKLQSTYYDTASHRLRDEKASLRIRWDGKNWIQTLKYGTGVEHGLSNPFEIECVLDKPHLDLDRIDDPGITPWLSDILSDGEMLPVFETEIDRTIHMLRCDDIGTVELAIDRGKVKNPEKSAAISEVEIELKSGLPFALLTVSEQLFDGERITASKASKAERGYALSRKPCGKKPNPKAVVKPAFSADAPAEKAFRAIGRSAAGQVLNNWNLLPVSDDPEVPHQLRVGLRRLRACLKVFRSFLTSDDLQRVSDDARDMGRVVGDLRNADVLLDDIAIPAIKALGNEKKHSATLKYLREGRDRQRRAVRKALAGKRWTFLKLNCMLFEQAVDRAFLNSVTPPPDERVIATSRRELDRTWRHVLKKGRGFADHRIEQRHEMRKVLKTMRYASEYFLPLFPGSDAYRFSGRLKRLQSVFGYLNDIAMAEQLAATMAKQHPDNAELQKSVAKIVGWHRSRAKGAMRKADRRWKKLRDCNKFWRVQSKSG